ncbi:hypothetical protein AVP41_01824 [Microbacterium sp. TNHR37B]|nr:hypothetical protein AVP41_01824 [Microbacterium sp. TNHR37B]
MLTVVVALDASDEIRIDALADAIGGVEESSAARWELVAADPTVLRAAHARWLDDDRMPRDVHTVAGELTDALRSVTTPWVGILDGTTLPDPAWLVRLREACAGDADAEGGTADLVVSRPVSPGWEQAPLFGPGDRLADLDPQTGTLPAVLPGLALRREIAADAAPSGTSPDALLLALLRRSARIRVAAGATYRVTATGGAASWGERAAALLDEAGHDRTAQVLALHRLRAAFLGELTLATAARLNTRDRAEVLDVATRVLTRIDPDVMRGYRLTPLRVDLRALFLVLGGSSLPFVLAHTTVRGPRSRTEIRMLHTSTAPHVVVRSADGSALPIVDRKWRTLDYFGQDRLREHILWTTGDPPAVVEVDGVAGAVTDRVYVYPPRPVPVPSPREAPDASAGNAVRSGSSRGGVAGVLRRLVSRPPRGSTPEGGPDARAGAEIPSTRPPATVEESPFTDAWLMMDRVDHAGDNAELLFTHLRRERPSINAWFVVAEGSPDFARLREESDRVLPYGGDEHAKALDRAVVVASSYVDAPMTHPKPDRLYPGGQRPWLFVYLQHGVLHNDLSLWFNAKPIDLMTTATQSEHEAIVGDGSPYVLSRSSVARTGFPRFDRVAQRALDRRPASPDTILLAPTWRLPLVRTGSDARRHVTDDVLESEFARQWLGLAGDARLREHAERHGARVLLLPHPAMRGDFARVAAGSGVLIADDDVDAVDALVRSRVVVTDYSSIAFDAAVAGSHVVYFQFDREAALGGGHTYRAGRFDYEREGLGPVTRETSAAVSAIERALHDHVDDPFRERRREVAETADGGAAARIVSAIEEHLSAQ